MKVYKYTYIHILWWDDTKFYKSMIELLHSSDKIDVSQHCFVTPYKKVYESIKEYDNTKLINLDGLPLLLKCSKYAKWIFCHPLNLTFVRCLLIPKNIANKIIWRTWGHDIRSYDDIPKDNNIIWLWKRRLFQLYIRKAKEFKCIGIANAVDKVNVNNVFGHDQKTVILPYGSTKVNILEKIRETETVDENSNNSIKIFVGHNGNAADRHINILKTLSRFSDQNISVIVDLINGSDPEYVKNVKTYAADIFGNKAVFLNDFMPFEDFSRVIYSCKICVLDNIYSNGLGTLGIMAYFHKKIYFNKEGNISQALRLAGVKPNYTDEIQIMEFSSFVSDDCENRLEDIDRLLGAKSKMQNIGYWEKALRFLGGGYENKQIIFTAEYGFISVFRNSTRMCASL